METLKIILMVLITIASILTILLVLLNRGKGGGLSDMFGGGMSSSLGGSTVAERNLTRITIAVSLIWAAAIVGIGLAVLIAAAVSVGAILPGRRTTPATAPPARGRPPWSPE